MIRLLIADDHSIFRQSLCRSLSDCADLTVVAQASNCDEIVAAIRTHEINLALLDLALPGCRGAEVVKQVKEMRPSLPVMVLTMHDNEPYITQALREGAEGYATKDRTVTELVDAIKQVHRGGRYLCPVALANLATGISLLRDTDTPHKRLSDREYTIFELLTHGMRGREIASRLSLSEKTISTHKMNLFRKMNISTRSELISYAIRNHLFNI
jgi:DNA-binding NarL/FixJ family response regulator